MNGFPCYPWDSQEGCEAEDPDGESTMFRAEVGDSGLL